MEGATNVMSLSNQLQQQQQQEKEKQQQQMNNNNPDMHKSLPPILPSDNDKMLSDKRSRRFSLYVYQHHSNSTNDLHSAAASDKSNNKNSSSTTVQPELFGYKTHHEDEFGYAYTHDSNEIDTSSSSSDSAYSLYRSAPSISPVTSFTQLRDVPASTLTSTSTSTLTSTLTSITTPTRSNGPATVTSQAPQSTTSLYHSQTQVLAYPHTVIPYALPIISPTAPLLAETQTLKPPDPNQLPSSYFSTVRSAYAADVRVGGGSYMEDEYNEKESILRPVEKSLSGAKDWNVEFQTLVNNNRMEGYREISKLAHDFVYTAKIYGKVIISELMLPLHLKTIKPINIGGVAGGHKYIALGILFKLALDSQGLYVGDHNAMKAAGHELKGLMSYYNARVEGLHHPLMTLIDYRGFRLVAMSLLPISGETIVYGSSDGGITVHSDNTSFNEKMEKSAQILNIKGHIVGRDNPRLLHSCGDIEGHIGNDGNFYLLDFARVFPPVVKIIENGPPSHLYELLRPELVKSNSKPLSSDALTGWGKFDPNSSEHNYEVKEASYKLFLKVIPKFVKYLDGLDMCEKKELHLTQELHRVGINCRYLGLIKRQVHCPCVRRIILCEMLARTIRSEVMALFRGKMKTADTPSEEPFKEVVVQYFNKVFKFESTPKGNAWPASLKESISKKFMGAFQILPEDRETITFESIVGKKFDEEMMKRYIRSDGKQEDFLVSDVDVHTMMKRFNQLSGVGLTQRAMKELQKQDSIRLVPSDVKRMKAKVKAHHLVEFAQGMVLWDEAKKEMMLNKVGTAAGSLSNHNHLAAAAANMPALQGAENNSERIADRLMMCADDHFRSALSVSPHSGEVSANWALMLVERARISRLTNPELADSQYHMAEEKLRTSVCDGGKPKITLDNVLLEYAEFLYIWGTYFHIELDMNEANGLRSKILGRCQKKIYEAIQINPSKFSVVLQKAKFLEKSFHESKSFREHAAYYAAISLVLDTLIQSYDKLPATFHREIAENITQNLSPIEVMMKEKEVAESPDLIHRSIDDDIGHKSAISLRKEEEEIRKLLETDPYAVIKFEMGCSYLRYGYMTHLFGIMCSKRGHTKQASTKLLKKAGSLMQMSIDTDPNNRDILIEHIKKFTSSSQFIDFYQSAIGCPSVIDFLEDRFSRIGHLSLKDCWHIPIELIEGLIEYSPKVKVLVLDGCTQVTDSTIELIAKKMLHLETLSLCDCVKITTIVSQRLLKEHLAEVAKNGKSQSSVSTGNLNEYIQESSSSSSSSSTKRCIFEKPSFKCHAGATPNQNILMTSLNNVLTASNQAPTSPPLALKPLGLLQNLNLSGCLAIKDDTIINIAQLNLPLLSISLKQCINITDRAIIQLTQHSHRLQSINLSGCTNIGDASIYAITSTCLGLRELNLNKCVNVTSSSIDKFCKTLQSSIRSLRLSKAPLAVTDDTLRLIGKYCIEMQHVNITNNTLVTDHGVNSLTKSVRNIVELNISYCVNISDQGIAMIASACPKLRILRMAGLNSVSSLRPIGNNCPELVELDVTECHKITSDLGCVTKGCPNLTIFKLRRCYGIQDAPLLSDDGEIHLLCKMTKLDWSHGNIEFPTIHSITHSCKSLTSLNISYCKSLKDSSLERIAASLPRLKKLKIDALVTITDDGIKALSEGSLHSNLEVLSLAGCRKITDVSARYILQFSNLRKISIGECMMTTSGAEIIVADSFELMQFNVRNCLNINIIHLKEKHPHICFKSIKKETAYFSE
ncbi:hypothetical protein SAMD00019534_040110 [Acytostelium subglobosum LB1]|uniref:hypothetical protein n=1 Tax=Acytostelium subglobosum LB1 TaxID=1410327 RepID=UPI000645091F|nr:hypothetical protein SAMD00019534_040110 [Acytostelium subglobosum LB1]GAM20836.1 hypothetical protein SAMD00019534_040110 [Acytostelium subglobosum LB1]|eukprot:XP_012755970.1 hypothetical protein SAMD00019534_040110 [Acytostelium subglobosum LB1]